jgi:hypothetical protein
VEGRNRTKRNRRNVKKKGIKRGEREWRSEP